MAELTFFAGPVAPFPSELSERQPPKKEMIMSKLTRFAFVAVALLGTVSAASAAPRYSTDSYTQSDQFRSGPIDDFNRVTHKQD